MLKVILSGALSSLATWFILRWGFSSRSKNPYFATIVVTSLLFSLAAIVLICHYFVPDSI
ncbi:MAG: hypothetical protein EOP06_02770 [Proteobacteria bacterium]|nr:MAG: hypothetical protein EOP06_02770 [Pseudomonadota bacterium]